MMMELNEPMHIYFSVCFLVFIAFLIYLMCRGMDQNLKNEQKNSN